MFPSRHINAPISIQHGDYVDVMVEFRKRSKMGKCKKSQNCFFVWTFIRDGMMFANSMHRKSTAHRIPTQYIRVEITWNNDFSNVFPLWLRNAMSTVLTFCVTMCAEFIYQFRTFSWDMKIQSFSGRGILSLTNLSGWIWFSEHYDERIDFCVIPKGCPTMKVILKARPSLFKLIFFEFLSSFLTPRPDSHSKNLRRCIDKNWNFRFRVYRVLVEFRMETRNGVTFEFILINLITEREISVSFVWSL